MPGLRSINESFQMRLELLRTFEFTQQTGIFFPLVLFIVNTLRIHTSVSIFESLIILEIVMSLKVSKIVVLLLPYAMPS